MATIHQRERMAVICFMCNTDGFREAFAYAAQAVSDFAAAASRAFAGVAEQYRKPVIGQAEESPVVVARSLTERRKKCRRKEWRASRK